MQEQKAIVEALKFSIQMELDGKNYYLKAGNACTNKLGKELYTWLATEEDRHRERFESIYRDISAGKGWQAATTKPDKGQKPANIFSAAAREAKTAEVDKNELAAVETAMQMEIKSRDYYKKQVGVTGSSAADSYFSALAAEENGHYLYLVDYKEYIADPTGWFTRTEHHLLDGA